MKRFIFCFWFGDSMSSNRYDCFQSLIKNSGVPILLITSDNLKYYLVPEFPIHPGFEYLSATHKSDYLRSYFMYFYGGGYSDIKRCNFDWNTYFSVLERSEKDFIGYQETQYKDIAYRPVREYYSELVGNGSFIFKPNTNFAKLWMDETNNLLDRKIKEL
jgi:hypothetical protein